MDELRLGYVGCGFMAQKVHIPNFAAIADCRLAAVAEVRSDIREKVADRYRIEHRYANHLDMAANGQLDAVAISAGFALQGEMAQEFLKRGIPVFMEKPMATTVERARQLVDACRQGGARLMVAYMKRYDAGNILARDAIRAFRESGELGPLTYVRAHGFCGDWLGGIDTPYETSSEQAPPSPNVVPDWLPENRVSGYLEYLQQYTHNINLCRWLLDAGDDARVRCVDLDDDGINGTTILSVAGVRTAIESGEVRHYGWDEHTQVYFREGWVKASAPSLLLKNVPATVEIYQAKPAKQTSYPVPTPAWTWAYKREAEEFINRVRSGEPFDSSAEDTLTDVRLYEDIYRSWLHRLGEV
jgi:predicted dehydrogenase